MEFICVTLMIIIGITDSTADQFAVVGPVAPLIAIPETVGSPPLITVDGFDVSGGLHLQCESKGWNPKPELVWLNSKGVTLTSETTDKQRDTDGFRVKHMITVYNRDSKYHCRVKLRHHMMETQIITSREKAYRFPNESKRIQTLKKNEL
ncbi:butyrophilin-like protein 3 [Misgurnus anguillicaudatus]|uniref:butyrophilin-like protein 3 n=1 Tax=Misgurnus anguillicaudatus TaxID=75329 RepID=UPI003CCF87A9